MRLLIAIAMAGIFANASPLAFAGPLEDAEAAVQRKDFETAIGLYRPLAEKGDPDAQYGLGSTLTYVLNPKKDPATGVKWLRKAAVQGHAKAQLSLGLDYSAGRGLPENPVLAMMWTSLAVSNADASFKEKARLGQALTQSGQTDQSIALAEEKAQRCLRSNYKKCD